MLCRIIGRLYVWWFYTPGFCSFFDDMVVIGAIKLGPPSISTLTKYKRIVVLPDKDVIDFFVAILFHNLPLQEADL